MAVKTKKKTEVKTLERGNIYFFYRPKIEEEDPGSLEEVQRLYLVLSPDKEERYRLAILGKKRLPEPGEKGQRYWGFIDIVRKSPNSIKDELSGDKYRTKTRGKRYVPPARPLGEGVYRLVLHNDHTHFVYALELPEQSGEVQKEFQIEAEGSFVISIKNPETPSPRGAGLRPSQEARFSKQLQGKFRGRRFAEADPPDFLNKEGAEFILIAAAEDIKKELGLDLNPEEETGNSADIFKDLRLDKSEHPTKPLFEGKWD